MTRTEFWELCDAHDWFHDFSDDGRVSRAGAAAEKQLAALAQEHNYRGDWGLWLNWRTSVIRGDKTAPQPSKP